MAFLEVKGLKAYYRQIEALHGLDFSLEEGSSTTIRGANVAGKTTTLRALCRMIRTEGEIALDGQDITGMATDKVVQLGIAHVPAGRSTFVRQSVEANLHLGAYTRRNHAEILADIERWFDASPRPGERQKQQAGTLSGGEQQMLEIGRALMLRPRLMLLDEPSFGLAPLIVQEIYSIMRRIRESEGTTMLLVEQNANIALNLADHAYLLETGNVVMSGESHVIRDDENVLRSYLGYWGRETMCLFFQLTLPGLAIGSIYACVALAVVMIYQATDHFNFAQGEMAMFATFICWTFLGLGLPVWVAAVLAIAASFIAGLVIERVIIKPVENAPVGQRMEGPTPELVALARAQGLEAAGPVTDLADLQAALGTALGRREAGAAYGLEVHVRAE